MSSDDSLVVKELKARRSKAEAELKEKVRKLATTKRKKLLDAEITDLKAEVKALSDQIVAHLALKEAKEEMKMALMEAALKNSPLPSELKEYFDTEIQKREADLVALTKPIVGLDGTLHELIADSQS
jgi:predicted  nucleic acid-binding Zn-ribbon protein